MTKKTLEKLYAEHVGKVSDKWSLYFNEYDRILDEYRNKPVRLLEIGIQNGGSLEIWSKYFPNAEKLVGCDINPDCARLSYEDPRIAVVVGDVNSDASQAAVLGHGLYFDVIIDDGSHRSSDIVKTFARYFPHLADGGVFIVEDLHCSYWQEFEGGLFDPFSSRRRSSQQTRRNANSSSWRCCGRIRRCRGSPSVFLMEPSSARSRMRTMRSTWSR